MTRELVTGRALARGFSLRADLRGSALAPWARLATLVALAAAALSACGDIETTPARDPDAGPSSVDAGVDAVQDAHAADAADPDSATATTIDAPADDRFVLEPHAPGDQWYNYDGQTHIVTPREEVYVFDRGDTRFAVELTSYYDRRGESGVFSLRAASLTRDGVGLVHELQLDGNVKRAPVCVRVAPEPRTVSCEGAWDLVFRTELRVIPGAGFAVNNPSIMARGHYASETTVGVRAYAVRAIEALPDQALVGEGGQVLRSSKDDPQASTIGLRMFNNAGEIAGHELLMATGDVQLAQWRLLAVAREYGDGDGTAGAEARGAAGAEAGGEVGVRIASRCVPLATSLDGQTAMENGAPGEVAFSLPATGFGVALVDLCSPDGPQVTELADEPFDGLWPRTDTFDLFVESYNGEIVFRPAPGTLTRRVHTREGDPAQATFGPVDLDGALWAD